MGTSDLTKDLHARHTRDRHPLVTSLGLCVLAARTHGLAALDGVHLDLDDEAGFAAACRQAREMGFDGKTLIHPKTIALRQRDLRAVSGGDRLGAQGHGRPRRSLAQGKGVIVVDGRLVENLHVEEARRLLALAEAIHD